MLTPKLRITNLTVPLHDGAFQEWGHLASVEYRAWAALIAPDGRFSEPLEAAAFYLAQAMAQAGANKDTARHDVDQARERGGEPAALVVNGARHAGVELSVFLLKARAAVVDGWTVVVVAPLDQEPELSLDMPTADKQGS